MSEGSLSCRPGFVHVVATSEGGSSVIDKFIIKPLVYHAAIYGNYYAIGVQPRQMRHDHLICALDSSRIAIPNLDDTSSRNGPVLLSSCPTNLVRLTVLTFIGLTEKRRQRQLIPVLGGFLGLKAKLTSQPRSHSLRVMEKVFQYKVGHLPSEYRDTAIIFDSLTHTHTPTSSWPDGSLKWTGHAVAAETTLSDTLHLAPGSPSEPASPITVKQGGGTITVTTGDFEGEGVSGQPDEPEANDPANIHTTTANVTAATVESDGPVRATIKVTGTYKGDGHGEWLPFTIRLYFSAGSTAIKIQHLFLFDGDQSKDFIKGIVRGVKFDVPLSDELYDRHIRFTSASGGLWGEAVRVLSGLRRDATAALLAPQFEGTALPAKDSGSWPATITAGIDTLPTWNDYTLVQLSADHFDIWKRAAGLNTLDMVLVQMELDTLEELRGAEFCLDYTTFGNNILANWISETQLEVPRMLQYGRILQR
ncbi:hypothetical protein AG1IA_08430 [Rhizoctonia solani AG-1 IA]|uniref:Uncharacterized protein n=1 Tax=Thanatephorus cucumeris (strain AG1-IA) TaxID=983506 RepID=L8WH76_THACA|nr:hypothetical protein AG1IA_08430 [Rhizoctonia solani AG-1 IA]